MSKDQNNTLVQLVENFKKGACTPGNHDHSTESCKMRNGESAKRKKSLGDYETPEKRLRTSGLFDDSVISSPWELRRVKADLVEARSRIVLLENQIQELHAVRQKLDLIFEKEKQTLQSQHTRDRNLLNDLEKRLHIVRKREVDLKEELVQVKSKFERSKLKSDKKIEELQQIIDQMKDEIHETSMVEQENSSVSVQRAMELEDALQAAQEDAEAQKRLVMELQAQLQSSNSANRDAEIKEQALQKALLRIKELEFERGNYLEWQELAKTQQNKLAAYPDLEKEVDRLREENKNLHDVIYNKLILEEQVADLQQRVNSFKTTQKELTDLQIKNKQLESYSDEWKAIARDLCECTGSDASLPIQLRKAVEHLQQQEVSLTSQKVKYESELKVCRREIATVKQDFEKLNKQFTEVQTRRKEKEQLISRLQKKLLLLSRERDSYRSQLDMYEKELTMTVDTTDSNHPSGNDMLKERVESLERVVDGYRELITKLESDLEAANPNQANAAPVRMEQIKRLQKEVDMLQSEKAQLLKRRDELETELEKIMTQSSSKEGKVLHFSLNPLAESQKKHEDEVTRLQNEVDKLKRKIKNLEEGNEVSKISESSLMGSSSQEVKNLQDKVKSCETTIQRLKDNFRTVSQEYRDVCHMLLGYKIDRVSPNNYKLLSMYAESPDDYLSFQLNDEGQLNLLETRFSASLEQLINLHLRHQKSIPVFLSAITTDLFYQNTMCTETTNI